MCILFLSLSFAFALRSRLNLLTSVGLLLFALLPRPDLRRDPRRANGEDDADVDGGGPRTEPEREKEVGMEEEEVSEVEEDVVEETRQERVRRDLERQNG